MESEEREYGITPNLGEFARYGLPRRYWGCDARYLSAEKGKRRIEIPPSRETYWGFTDKAHEQQPQEDFMSWINGVFFPLLRRNGFDKADYAVVDPEFRTGTVYVGRARLNRTKTRLLIGTWERDTKKRRG